MKNLNLNNEIWERWDIIKNKNLLQDIKSIIFEGGNLVIELYDARVNLDNLEPTIIITFDLNFAAYKITGHYYSQDRYKRLIDCNRFNPEWHSYVIKNSPWVNELTRKGNIIIEDKKIYVHYAITEENYTVEVISVREPKIEIIKKS
ncbi:hypothetical protein KJ644_01685 [Candidatus Dependentiae bacterium]|nr:hypothetical protein [Candidatus Dependentiae bacterium]MBU4387163.1 hypothetical protein [Candidatus Dependentiae bacterium]MCG2756748.1 hypothetical protein [Candidatus Dependentiae bacterium]